MNDDSPGTELVIDETEDLWWVFYLSQIVRQDLGYSLAKVFTQRGMQVISEHLSQPFFQIVVRDTLTDIRIEISNASDDLKPYLFLGMKADLVLPPDAVTARLNADLFLELGKIGYQVLQPKYAFGENLNMYVEMADVDASRLTHVCWANLFGPQFVRGIGRDLLINAPAWRNENLGDGGLLYVLAASPYLYQGPQQYWGAARQYFNQHIPGVIVWSDMPG